MKLSEFTDQELTDELRERELKRRHAEAQEIKKREVEVICPACNGSGKISYYSMRVAAGEEDGTRPCELCNSNGTLIALRVKI